MDGPVELPERQVRDPRKVFTVFGPLDPFCNFMKLASPFTLLSLSQAEVCGWT